MNAMNPQTTAPTQAPQAPATLDGVSIQDCRFTESVGKREPRPPLVIGPTTQNIWLRIDREVVCIAPGPMGTTMVAGRLVNIWPGFRMRLIDAIPYTGPITPAMWAIIRKYWNP